MKHVGQGTVNQTHRPLQVKIGFDVHGKRYHERLIPFNPAFVSRQEAIAFFDGSDPRQAEQEVSELLSRSGLRVGSKPPASLMLQMKKASLNLSVGPDRSNDLQGRTFPIHCKDKGIQTLFSQAREPVVGGWKAFFRHIKGGRNDLIFNGVHESHQAAILVKISAIQNQILVRLKVLWFGWGLFKPVCPDPIEFGDTVTRDIRELPNGQVSGNPELEPMLLPILFVFLVLSNEGLKADRTSKSLFCIRALTKTFNKAGTTTNTVFFFS